MKRILTQSEPTSLPTGIEVEYNFRKAKSLMSITSKKIQENPDFNKPFNQLNLCN